MALPDQKTSRWWNERHWHRKDRRRSDQAVCSSRAPSASSSRRQRRARSTWPERSLFQGRSKQRLGACAVISPHRCMWSRSGCWAQKTCTPAGPSRAGTCRPVQSARRSWRLNQCNWQYIMCIFDEEHRRLELWAEHTRRILPRRRNRMSQHTDRAFPHFAACLNATAFPRGFPWRSHIGCLNRARKFGEVLLPCMLFSISHECTWNSGC